MVWTQNYDPLHSSVLSPLLAALPVVLLLGLLATGRVPAALAALAGLVGAVLVAVFGFTPVEALAPGGPGVGAWAGTVLTAAGYGAAFGLLPIGWIVLAAIFLYNLTVATGHFETVKHSVVSLSDDRRIQALLIAFCFGAFVEGAAGFGTPVAISGALLIGAGFRPLHAAGLALLANTAPVAFGALGTPILTLAQVTGLSELKLSAMAGRQLPFFSLLVPVWLVWVMAGWRGVLGVWPALAVCGGSFALVQFLVANYHGPWLVDVAGGLVSLVSLALFLRVWQPRETWHFPEERVNASLAGASGWVTPTQPEAPARDEASLAGASGWVTPTQPEAPARDERTAALDHETQIAKHAEMAGPRSPAGTVWKAWVPWGLLTVFVFCWGVPQVKEVLGRVTVKRAVPGLHLAVTRTAPVVTDAHPEAAVYSFAWLATTGTGIFLAALASACWLRVGPVRFLHILGVTTYRLRWPLFTIACMLAIAFTTRYSGMDATLGLAFTRTGRIYPLFAALLGWLGVALTGSDTSSNALFGSLQTITARRLVDAGVLPLSVEQASLLLASANSTGGVMGKMIDAQSIVVSAAATQQTGEEGAILRFVFGHSLALALLMGVLVLVQAYLWTSIIP